MSQESREVCLFGKNEIQNLIGLVTKPSCNPLLFIRISANVCKKFIYVISEILFIIEYYQPCYYLVLSDLT